MSTIEKKEIQGGLLKLKTAQKKSYDGIQRVLTQMISEMQTTINNSSSNSQSPPSSQTIVQYESNLKEKSTQITEHLKNYHAQISKYSKVLDKIPVESPLELNSPQLTSRIDPYLLFAIQHLIRTAKRSAVEALVASGHYRLTDAERSHLYSISPILEELHCRGNVDFVEDWVMTNATEINKLQDKKSSTDHITFHIVVLRFLSFLSTGLMEQYTSALLLSQSLFPHFLTTYPGEYDSRIAELMGCLLIALPSSQLRFQSLPWLHLYPHLTLEKSIEKLSSLLIETSAQIHGLPPKDHLESLVKIGQLTAPTIRKALNLKAFNNSQSNENKSPVSWADLQDLPLEFPEDDSLIFHTVFTCPVSREVATPENPPVLLSCGHAILKSSMRQLPKKGSGRFKCPTCYGDVRNDDFLELQL